MTSMPRSLRQERAHLAIELRHAGMSWVQIAEDFRRRYRVNARVAFRMAHGWSQNEVATIGTAPIPIPIPIDVVPMGRPRRILAPVPPPPLSYRCWAASRRNRGTR